MDRPFKGVNESRSKRQVRILDTSIPQLNFDPFNY